IILDNGYCHIVSDAMYISDCAGPGQQSLAQSGGSGSGFDSQGEAATHNTVQLEPEILLIPNPATNQTRIQYRFDGTEAQKTIEIYDLTGRKVKTLSPQNDAGSIVLQLGGFVGGIYQICLKQDGHIIAQS